MSLVLFCFADAMLPRRSSTVLCAGGSVGRQVLQQSARKGGEPGEKREGAQQTAPGWLVHDVPLVSPALSLSPALQTCDKRNDTVKPNPQQAKDSGDEGVRERLMEKTTIISSVSGGESASSKQVNLFGQTAVSRSLLFVRFLPWSLPKINNSKQQQEQRPGAVLTSLPPALSFHQPTHLSLPSFFSSQSLCQFSNKGRFKNDPGCERYFSVDFSGLSRRLFSPAMATARKITLSFHCRLYFRFICMQGG